MSVIISLICSWIAKMTIVSSLCVNFFHLLALKPNLEIFSIYSGRWFSPGTPASSTTKTGRHDIAESGAKHQKINQSIIFFKKLFSLISLHRIQFYLSRASGKWFSAKTERVIITYLIWTFCPEKKKEMVI